MASLAGRWSAAPQQRDRNVFLVFVSLVWVGVLSGFGFDSLTHVAEHGLDYPLIVHLHAVIFVGWLTLFTVQTALIRRGNKTLHRRLGLAGAVLAGVMLIIGPATAITVDATRFTTLGETPEFLGVQLTDMLGFGVLTAAGLMLRHDAGAHKRLMLLGLFYLSDAGFARLLNALLVMPFEGRPGSEWAHLYLCSTLLAIALGVYDLMTRRRLHPAYIAGMVWIAAMEATGQNLLHSAAWKTVALGIIGH